jgi:hypothetical protein
VVFVRAAFIDLAATWLVKPPESTANDNVSKDKGRTDILVFRTSLLCFFEGVL